MRRKIKETIETYHMLCPGEQVVVGLSGGADSVSLLSFLWEERHEYQISLTACHVNHNLRGEESERDENFVRDFCKKLGIPLFVFCIDALGGAKNAMMSVELYAREERYRIFGNLANQLEGENNAKVKIATAHTLSDKAETILFNLARGTSLKGLEGIPAVRGRIIRPLINCTRKEIEKYCSENNLSFVTDSTNLLDDYTRNRIRHRVVPELEEVNPAFLQSVRRMSESVRRDREFLDSLADKALDNLQNKSEKISKILIKDLLELDRAILERIVAKLLGEAGAEISAKKIGELIALAKSGSGQLEVVKGKRFSCKNGFIYIEAEKKYFSYFEKPLEIGQNQLFEGKKVNILLCDYEKYKNIKKNNPDDLKKVLDYDRIEDVAVIRQKKDGDRMLLYNKMNTRPLKKIFNEAKIQLEQRSRIAVISDSLGVIWAEGFGCDKRAALSDKTKRVLVVEVEEEKEKEEEEAVADADVKGKD